MLNLADLALLVIVMCGPFAGWGAAHVHHAEVGMASLSIAGGLGCGVLVAAVTNQVMYRLLKSKRLPLAVSTLAYVLAPAAGLLLVLAAPFAAWSLVFTRR